MLLSLLIFFSFQANAHDANTLKSCPNFKPKYMSCKKTGGSIFEFFDSVEISKTETGFKFLTQTVQGPFESRYTPDRVVRLGSDYHFTEDGKMIPNLRSHESSYCESESLFQHEISYLPNQQIAEDVIEFKINKHGNLIFILETNGHLLLRAECREEAEN